MNDLSETAKIMESAAAAAPAAAAVATAPASPSWSSSVSSIRGPLTRWWSRQPLTRFIRKSLGRRILVSNILGLFGLLLGMLYLSLSHAWLLDAKIEVVRTLSRVTAEAIAYRATNDVGRCSIPISCRRPARPSAGAVTMRSPPSSCRSARNRRRRSSRSSIQPTDLIARIYSPKGTLIVDSDMLFGKYVQDAAPATPSTDSPRLKNFWTRFHYWLNNKELKVYRELGTANGFLYPEVKKAAEQGVETPILLLDSKGQQIVSMAAPVKRNGKIIAVLLLMTQPGEIDETLWDERWLILQIAAIALAASIVVVAAARARHRRAHEAAVGCRRQRQPKYPLADLPDFAERSDEVGQMGRAFSAMTSALYRRIEASEKFAADVAHELKNPLAAARSTAEALHVRTHGRRPARARAGNPERVEAAEPLDQRRLERLAARRRTGAPADAAHQPARRARQRHRHFPRPADRRYPQDRPRHRTGTIRTRN